MSTLGVSLCSMLAFFSIATTTILCCRYTNFMCNKPPHYYLIAQASAAQTSAAQTSAQASAQESAQTSAAQASASAQAIVEAPKYESYQNSPPKYEDIINSYTFSHFQCEK